MQSLVPLGPGKFHVVVLVYILLLFLIGEYVTGNASRARAEVALVLNTCLDIKNFNLMLKMFT